MSDSGQTKIFVTLKSEDRALQEMQKRHTGAETAATLYTIIESARKNDLDPRTFILMSLQQIAADKPVMTPLEYAKHIRVPATPPSD